MTVKELIEKLSQYPPDLRVTVDGYEGGLTEHLEIRKINIYTDKNTESWYGEHEEVSPFNADNGDLEVLNIGRGSG